MAGTAPIRTLLLGSVSAGVLVGVTTGTSQPIHANAQNQLSFYLTSIGVTSGGTILLEEADWGGQETPYAGTWSQIASITANSFTGGAQLAYHTTAPAAYGYVRARISSPITGGGAIACALRMR